LNKNAHLRAELEFLTKLSENLKADADDFEPGEFGWSRLNRDIDAFMPDQSGESQTPKYPATPKFWRYAAMALAVLSVGQGALLIQKSTYEKFYTPAMLKSFQAPAPLDYIRYDLPLQNSAQRLCVYMLNSRAL